MRRIETRARSIPKQTSPPSDSARSERARMQPRDTRGRFARYGTVMVLDEFGNVGLLPSRSEKYFGYGVSVTKNPEAFAAVTADNRFHHEGEWKARDDTVEKRARISRCIASTETDTYGYFIDKRNPPEEWYADDRAELMTRIMEYSVRSTLPETKGDVLVVVDGHKAYGDRAKQVIERTDSPWKRVTGDQFSSADGEYSDLLQTQDYVANAVRSHLEVGDPTRTTILKTRMHQIENGEIHDRNRD